MHFYYNPKLWDWEVNSIKDMVIPHWPTTILGKAAIFDHNIEDL